MGTPVPLPPPPATPNPPAPEFVFARAVSVLTSRMMWVNFGSFFVEALALSEVYTLIPPKYAHAQALIVAVVNMWLRKQTVRPVAFISPGSVSVVPIPKIDPPAPKVTD